MSKNSASLSDTATLKSGIDRATLGRDRRRGRGARSTTARRAPRVARSRTARRVRDSPSRDPTRRAAPPTGSCRARGHPRSSPTPSCVACTRTPETRRTASASAFSTRLALRLGRRDVAGNEHALRDRHRIDASALRDWAASARRNLTRPMPSARRVAVRRSAMARAGHHRGCAEPDDGSLLVARDDDRRLFTVE